MAGIVISPQLRASPDARNVHDSPVGAFCAAWASQPDARSAATRARADRQAELMAVIVFRPDARVLSGYFRGQRGELQPDDTHLKRVRGMCVENVEVPVADAELAHDVVGHACRPPEAAFECLDH